ncbi:zinc finger, CCHC-type containing protein [Tanacetum coccineum]
MTTPMPELMKDDIVEAIRQRAKWENNDYICRGHILNGMSDPLFDIYQNIESAKELYDSLEFKYMAEDSSSKKFLKRVRIKTTNKTKERHRGSMINNGSSGSNKKLKLECWKYGKTGHFMRDCHNGNKKSANAGGSKKGYKDQSQDQGIIHETTAPYTPQQNGVAKWKNKALEKMGCRAVVRLPDPKRKTLGEKGVDCIFVGYVNHSKDYRFYVIEPNDSVSINSIIESRDAIFDENRFSSIPRPNDVIPNSVESQRDVHSDDVPSETPEPRRCKRVRKAKSYGSDFQLYLVVRDREIKFDSFGKCAIICLYVDDILIFRTVQNQVDKTEKFLSSRFSMKDMGEADVILRIKIKRENKGIVITQSHYIEKILKKFNHEDCSPVSTPIDPVEKLKPNTGKPVDQLEYSRAIGCLMYAMTSTRPDIAYAVGRLSRFTSNPSTQHWHAITRVFKYLKGTMNYGLSYVGYPSVLEAYSDASWINHVEDSSSTSG